ncbi:anti-repressor SinI family protein [Thalassobacillus sp. CUG 92003]|uniref:anti-repressor SinI family protein n=1 Tax=Thalassobacillus sp. CUG 92003 TaxID=2736641 RepID=UPI00272D5607|nr:anti-repressor SinI family protein [Thalassobacillus sp. CUG 92003]
MEGHQQDIRLDEEWIALMKEAEHLGLSKEEVKAFLQRTKGKPGSGLVERVSG